MAAEVTRRPGSHADQEFLFDLLKESLGPHIEATYGPWDERWQRRHFLETSVPEAHEIVEKRGEPIGCLLIEEKAAHIELQRILILPEHQNRGVGTNLVGEVLAAAAGKRKSVRLQVLRVSPANRFYERLGFQRVGETETHLILEHIA